MKSNNRTLKLLIICSLTTLPGLTGCRMFDYYGWTIAHSEGDINRGITHETTGDAIMFNAGWDGGIRHKAYKNMAQLNAAYIALAIANIKDMDVSRSGAVSVRETDSHPEGHTDVHFVGGQGKDKDEEEDPVEPYLSMLERVLVAVISLFAVGGTAAAITKHKHAPKPESTEND